MSSEENPYLALREAKIKRNEARLRQLGLTSKQELVSSTIDRSRVRQPQSNATVASIPVRRSRRLSSLAEPVNYKDSTSDLDPLRAKRPRVVTPSTDVQSATSLEDEGDPKPLKPQQAAGAPKPPAANSVRGISICAQRLALGLLHRDSILDEELVVTTGLLGLPLEQTGKDYVISKSFEVAGSSEDKHRLGGSRLSFNKYSGVQEWHDCIFLWVNLGAKGGTIVNEFLEGGKKITWFGGSRMVDDSPVVEKLIRWGKEATDSSSKIVLWCRQFDSDQNRFHPYVCLGRLSYDSHKPGSYPLTFVWSLLDAERMQLSGNSAVRENFSKFLNH
jgi:hypothetical protein